MFTVTAAATKLKMCIADIRQWMSANRIKLNTDKSELLWPGRDIAHLNSRVMVQPYSSAQTLFHRVTYYGC